MSRSGHTIKFFINEAKGKIQRIPKSRLSSPSFYFIKTSSRWLCNLRRWTIRRSIFFFAICDFNNISFFVGLVCTVWFTSVCEAKQINISMVIKKTNMKIEIASIGKSKHWLSIKAIFYLILINTANLPSDTVLKNSLKTAI